MAQLTVTNLDRKRLSWDFWKKQAIAYLYILPALLIFSLMTFRPMVATIIFSFQKVNLAKPPEWLGIQNYTRMFGNPLFYTAWKNIFGFLGLSILIGFMVPVFLALMINEMRNWGRVFQTNVYFPSLIPVSDGNLFARS